MNITLRQGVDHDIANLVQACSEVKATLEVTVFDMPSKTEMANTQLRVCCKDPTFNGTVTTDAQGKFTIIFENLGTDESW